MTVTVNIWDRVEVQGEIALQVRPEGTVSVRLTVPVNPLTAETVMVEVIWVPGLPDAFVATIVKSVTVKVAVVLWISVPLVPVMVRV